MAYDVCISDVTEGFSLAPSIIEVDGVLAWVNTADACLTGAGIDEATGRLLKIYAARHVLQVTANDGLGAATSQSSASGASRSFSPVSGQRLGSSSYGALLQAMDKSGCVTGLFSSNSGLAFMSVGPSR